MRGVLRLSLIHIYFEEKGNNIMKDIKFYVIVILAAVLVLALWYDWNHPEINLFPMLFPILV